MKKLKSFHVNTKDGSGDFNFFTEAKCSKDALLNLLENSFDFENLVSCKKDLIITIKHIK